MKEVTLRNGEFFLREELMTPAISERFKAASKGEKIPYGVFGLRSLSDAAPSAWITFDPAVIERMMPEDISHASPSRPVVLISVKEFPALTKGDATHVLEIHSKRGDGSFSFQLEEGIYEKFLVKEGHVQEPPRLEGKISRLRPFLRHFESFLRFLEEHSVDHACDHLNALTRGERSYLEGAKASLDAVTIERYDPERIEGDVHHEGKCFLLKLPAFGFLLTADPGLTFDPSRSPLKVEVRRTVDHALASFESSERLAPLPALSAEDVRAFRRFLLEVRLKIGEKLKLGVEQATRMLRHATIFKKFKRQLAARFSAEPSVELPVLLAMKNFISCASGDVLSPRRIAALDAFFGTRTSLPTDRFLALHRFSRRLLRLQKTANSIKQISSFLDKHHRSWRFIRKDVERLSMEFIKMTDSLRHEECQVTAGRAVLLFLLALRLKIPLSDVVLALDEEYSRYYRHTKALVATLYDEAKDLSPTSDRFRELAAKTLIHFLLKLYIQDVLASSKLDQTHLEQLVFRLRFLKEHPDLKKHARMIKDEMIKLRDRLLSGGESAEVASVLRDLLS